MYSDDSIVENVEKIEIEKEKEKGELCYCGNRHRTHSFSSFVQKVIKMQKKRECMCENGIFQFIFMLIYVSTDKHRHCANTQTFVCMVSVLVLVLMPVYGYLQFLIRVVLLFVGQIGNIITTCPLHTKRNQIDW